MNDTAVMSAGERAGDLNAVAQDGPWRQSRIGAHAVQRLALDQFHHDVELAVRLANFVDGADVGMSESRRSTGFVEQILACRRIKTSILVNHFQGHIAVQHFVISAIDNTHASFTDLRYDTAMTENLADHRTPLPRPMLG